MTIVEIYARMCLRELLNKSLNFWVALNVNMFVVEHTFIY